MRLHILENLLKNEERVRLHEYVEKSEKKMEE